MKPSLQTLDAETLELATGGIFYDQPKTPSGERWAGQVDAGAKSFYDHVSPYLGKNVTGVAMLPSVAVGEVVARTAGRVWDSVIGARP